MSRSSKKTLVPIGGPQKIVAGTAVHDAYTCLLHQFVVTRAAKKTVSVTRVFTAAIEALTIAQQAIVPPSPPEDVVARVAE